MEQGPGIIPPVDRSKETFKTIKLTERTIAVGTARGMKTLDSYLEACRDFDQSKAKITSEPGMRQALIESATRFNEIRYGTVEAKRKFCASQAAEAEREARRIEEKAAGKQAQQSLAAKKRALGVGWLLLESSLD